MNQFYKCIITVGSLMRLKKNKKQKTSLIITDFILRSPVRFISGYFEITRHDKFPGNNLV